MTRKELDQQYWQYYLLLEKRFIDSIEYVELSIDNFDSFSNSYALLIQAIGAELDTVFKVYCGFNTADRKCITDYVIAIDAEENQQNPCEYPIRNQKILIREYNLEIQPFMDWDAARPADSLSWWKGFIGLKHNRYDNRKFANQENALNILGALYLLEMKLLKRITEGTDELDVFDKGSALFSLREWSIKAIPMSEAFGILGDAFDKGDEAFNQKHDV